GEERVTGMQYRHELAGIGAVSRIDHACARRRTFHDPERKALVAVPDAMGRQAEVSELELARLERHEPQVVEKAGFAQERIEPGGQAGRRQERDGPGGRAGFVAKRVTERDEIDAVVR